MNIETATFIYLHFLIILALTTTASAVSYLRDEHFLWIPAGFAALSFGYWVI